MHYHQLDFVRRVKMRFPEYFLSKKVLEVGSLNINGSVRQLFENCPYMGIDLGEGAGVDFVISGHELDSPDNAYDVSLSCECFEHNKYWKETFENMIRMTSGLVIVSCATTGRPEHGVFNHSAESSPFTNDYYKNLEIADFLPFMDSFKEYGFEINKGIVNDLYLWGLK